MNAWTTNRAAKKAVMAEFEKEAKFMQNTLHKVFWHLWHISCTVGLAPCVVHTTDKGDIMTTIKIR